MKYTCNRAPMGWNSYDYYDTTVTEADVLRNAEWMKNHLLSSGYEYVVIDIEWYAKDAGTRRNIRSYRSRSYEDPFLRFRSKTGSAE